MSEQPETPPEPVNSVHAAEPAGPAPEFVGPLSTDPGKLPDFPTPHADKFRLALAVLGGIALAAIVIAVVALSTHHTDNGTAGNQTWSAWAPSSGGSAGAQEIADYIAPFYRDSVVKQLDVVTPLSLTSETSAGTLTGKGLTIAVNATSSSSSDSLSLLTGSTVAYNLCGLGSSDCALPGTPSTDRLLLLRREALELALYTFKYLRSSQNVLVVLPPGRTVATGKSASSKSTSSKSGSSSSSSLATTPITVAVLFVRAELTPLLDVPIADTLQEDPPDDAELALWSKSDEAGLVDQVTARGLFSEQVESQQEGGDLLVLTPISPQ